MNSEAIKTRLFEFLKNENRSGKYYPISISQKMRIPIKTLLSVLFGGLLLIVGCSVFLFDKAPFISWLLMLGYLFFTIRIFYRRIKARFFNTGKPYESTLRNFILKNDLYETFSNGDIKSELSLGYSEDKENDTLSVVVGKDGGRYQEIADNLADKLESALDLKFYKKVSKPTYIEYIFRTKPVERFVINQLPLEDSDMRIKIFGEQEISLRQNFSTLISGASGSGKSYFSYNVWADLCAKYVVREGKRHHVKTYVIDFKMADLYKHCVVSGYPKNMYGSTVADAFRIIREFTEELEKRKKIYANIDEFDKVLLDLGYEPQVLFIDEYPSLVAQMDNKQLKDWEAMLGNIARLSRQLSLGVILVMQQAGAGDNGLPTAIREQLVNKIFMGNSETISQQSSEMVFGVSRKTLPSPLHEVGEGLISIDGKEPVSFLSPRFNNEVDEVIQPVLVNAVSNWKKNSEAETIRDEIDVADFEDFL